MLTQKGELWEWEVTMQRVLWEWKLWRCEGVMQTIAAKNQRPCQQIQRCVCAWSQALTCGFKSKKDPVGPKEKKKNKTYPQKENC